MRGVFFATSFVVKGEDRPSRMEETAYLARLFMVHPNKSEAENPDHRRQTAGDFAYYSLSTPLLPLPKSRDQVVGQQTKEERSDWLGVKPWGHLVQV